MWTAELNGKVGDDAGEKDWGWGGERKRYGGRDVDGITMQCIGTWAKLGKWWGTGGQAYCSS